MFEDVLRDYRCLTWLPSPGAYDPDENKVSNDDAAAGSGAARSHDALHI